MVLPHFSVSMNMQSLDPQNAMPDAMPDDMETQAEREALRWFVILRDDAVAETERRDFGAWLDGHPENGAAWHALQQIWNGFDRLPQESITSVSLSDYRVAVPERSRGPWLAAAAVVLLLLIGGILGIQGPGMARAMLADHHTGTMDRKDVALSDGSNVTLGAASSLSVAFDATARRVTLHDGEAFFSVAHDARRPFIVTAGAGTVTVTGTKFDVKIAAERVTVAVAEGTVLVAAGSGPALPLSAGHTAQYSATGIQPGNTVDISDIGAWREGHLVFQGARLADVLADLERYRGGQIFVTDETLAALPVTGAFDIKRSDAALDTVAHALHLRMTRIADFLVLVSPEE